MKIFLAAPLVALVLLAGCKHLSLPFGGGESSPEAKTSSRNLTEQGYQLLAQEQPRAALAIFEQAAAGDNKNMRALQGKGIALNQLGKHDEAEAAYAEALKIEPGAVAVTNNLAMSKILRGKYPEAIELLTPLAPNPTVTANMALANCMLGKHDEAKKLYDKNLPPKLVEENLNFCKKFSALKNKQ